MLSASSGKLKDRNISTNKTYRKIFTDNSQWAEYSLKNSPQSFSFQEGEQFLSVAFRFENNTGGIIMNVYPKQWLDFIVNETSPTTIVVEDTNGYLVFNVSKSGEIYTLTYNSNSHAYGCYIVVY